MINKITMFNGGVELNYQCRRRKDTNLTVSDVLISKLCYVMESTSSAGILMYDEIFYMQN